MADLKPYGVFYGAVNPKTGNVHYYGNRNTQGQQKSLATRHSYEYAEYVLVPKNEYERAKEVLSSDGLKNLTKLAGLNNFAGIE